MRRGTLIAIVGLLLLLLGAGLVQLLLANRDVERFPGPVKGTPLPSASATR